MFSFLYTVFIMPIIFIWYFIIEILTELFIHANNSTGIDFTKNKFLEFKTIKDFQRRLAFRKQIALKRLFKWVSFIVIPFVIVSIFIYLTKNSYLYLLLIFISLPILHNLYLYAFATSIELLIDYDMNKFKKYITGEYIQFNFFVNVERIFIFLIYISYIIATLVAIYIVITTSTVGFSLGMEIMIFAFLSVPISYLFILILGIIRRLYTRYDEKVF